MIYNQLWLEFKTDYSLIFELNISKPTHTQQLTPTKISHHQLCKLISLVRWCYNPCVMYKSRNRTGYQFKFKTDSYIYDRRYVFKYGQLSFYKNLTRIFKVQPRYDYQNFRHTLQTYTCSANRWQMLFA